MRSALSSTTNKQYKTDYEGPLDFAFFVHARDVRDIFTIYPHLNGHSEADAYDTFARHHAHIGCTIEVPCGGATLYGELIGVPLVVRDFRRQLRSVRESLFAALDYCESRQTRIVGLGALLPSMTQFGRVLAERSGSIGITTGHSFTAHAIAEHVRTVESLLGAPQSVAIVGAAGSTGRAAIHALSADSVSRRLTLVDLPERLRSLSDIAPPPTQETIITADLASIRHSSVVVCVTNSTTAILRPEFLAPDCIVIDDAQPENITYAIARQRPDVVVIKCLARVPRLQCPFDFGLLPNAPHNSKQEIVFTCLAETVTLAASGHTGHFTIGSPTREQIASIAGAASRLGITIAPFHSFPEVGEVHDHPRFTNSSSRVFHASNERT